MLILPLYPTGRRWPEVAPIAPLWVTESILSSDTDGLSVVLDFKLTNVCRVDGQVLRSRNKSHHSSNATFMLSCDIFVIVLLWTVFTLISHKYFIISLTFLYYLHFSLILFLIKVTLQSVDSSYLWGFWGSAWVITPFASPLELCNLESEGEVGEGTAPGARVTPLYHRSVDFTDVHLVRFHYRR